MYDVGYFSHSLVCVSEFGLALTLFVRRKPHNHVCYAPGALNGSTKNPTCREMGKRVRKGFPIVRDHAC